MSNLYRVQKFELHLTNEQQHAILAVSENLRMVWNLAVEARENAYEKHLAPAYALVHEAQKAGDKAGVKAAKELLAEGKLHPEMVQNANAFAQQKHLLTPLRAENVDVAKVPRSWQNDCLCTLDASFKSYYQLKKNGDTRARKPGQKPEGWFQEITASDTNAFRMANGNSAITLPCKHIASAEVMTFPIPRYQQEQLSQGEVRKFTLFRCKQGRYWISVAYAIQAPEPLPEVHEQTLYLALGTSAIGILAPPLAPGEPWREEVVNLPRPDLHWKPKIDAVSERMRKLYREGAEKQSRKYLKQKAARAEMYRLFGEQNKLRQREIAQLILNYGPYHVVATDLSVRGKQHSLADAAEPQRNGTLGLNWQVQNTGWITNMLAWLRIKASERGTGVKTLPCDEMVEAQDFNARKLVVARRLRTLHLATRA